MRTEYPRRIFEFRNKASKVKIQLKDGLEFDAFSHVVDAKRCKADLASGDDTCWHFWKEACVAIHQSSYVALSAAMRDGLTLKWKYDENNEVLQGLSIYADDTVDDDKTIEDFANSALHSACSAMDASLNT